MGRPGKILISIHGGIFIKKLYVRRDYKSVDKESLS